MLNLLIATKVLHIVLRASLTLDWHTLTSAMQQSLHLSTKRSYLIKLIMIRNRQRQVTLALPYKASRFKTMGEITHIPRHRKWGGSQTRDGEHWIQRRKTYQKKDAIQSSKQNSRKLPTEFVDNKDTGLAQITNDVRLHNKFAECANFNRHHHLTLAELTENIQKLLRKTDAT